MLRPETISTLSLRTTSLDQLQRGQTALARAQAEQASGRLYDVGLALASGVARNLDWHGELARIEALATRNELAAVQAGVAQDAMEGIRKLAQSLMTTLAGSGNAATGRAVAQGQAEAAWGSLVELLGASQNGQHIFAGINSAEAPLSAYAGGTGEAAVAASFQAAFGMSQTDAATGTITGSQLDSYLGGTFASLFDDPSWQANWSTASDDTQTVRVGDRQQISIAVSANAEGFRAVAEGIAMVMDLGRGPLNDAAFKTLTSRAMARLTQGMDAITAEQARVGLAQQTLSETGDRLLVRRDYLTRAITNSEGVDQTEVAVRINTLMTQLEAGYAVTSRLSRLSLLNYLD